MVDSGEKRKVNPTNLRAASLAALIFPCLLCSCAPQAVSQAPAAAQPNPSPQKVVAVPDGKPPAWLVKMDPEAATAQATLDKRFSVERREQIFTGMKQQQEAEQVRIHAQYVHLPPETSAEEGMRRSADEGQKISDAQNKVFDDTQRVNHLDNDQMGALVQEAQEHHWGAN